MFNCITSDSKSRQLRYKNLDDFHWNLLQKSSTGKIISEQDRNVTFSTISTTYYKLKNNWLGLTLKLSVLTQWCSWENVDHDRNEHKNSWISLVFFENIFTHSSEIYLYFSVLVQKTDNFRTKNSVKK